MAFGDEFDCYSSSMTTMTTNEKVAKKNSPLQQETIGVLTESRLEYVSKN
jgi:hypothetical protein